MTLAFQHLDVGADGDTEIIGTGLRVYTIWGLYETGDSAEYIADEYGVPIAGVYEAIAYAAAHPDEMEAIRRADEEAERGVLSQLPDYFRRQAEETIRADEEARQEAIKRTREARLGAVVP